MLILTSCLLIVGIVGYTAYTFGMRVARDNTLKLSPADVQKYGLTEFPLEQAGRFAADFARLCMTHTPEGDPATRQSRLAQYVSSGVSPSCGWSGSGTQEVIESAWTGASEPIDIAGLEGHARMMNVRIITAEGRHRVLTIPVYVKGLRTGQGMKVIGDIGEMPQPLLASPPELGPVGTVDSKLTDSLVENHFFGEFFEAWGSSEEASLTRFVTADATDRAVTGLDGTLKSPQVRDAKVFFPESGSSDEFQWEQGDETEAWVWVTWSDPDVGGDVTLTRAYRLQLVKTESEGSPSQIWAVKDVRGGVPDVETD